MAIKTSNYSKFALAVALLVFVAIILPRDKPSCTEQYAKNTVIHTAGGKSLSAETASTEPERERGLSGRQCIPEQTAMLFQFDAPGYYGIWMKAMHFPIDVVWLDSAKRVVSIEKSMSPDSYPRIFTPPAESLYIVELHDGQALKLDLTIGSQLSW